ncbi:hypothetical protein AAMO2058_000617500 [Amorphochlora amoebiformis]
MISYQKLDSKSKNNLIKKRPIKQKGYTNTTHKKQQNKSSVNDPSAGSPTETLLRLLLPLNHQVRSTFQEANPLAKASNSPWRSPNNSIGSSDGRCVQRTGT